MRLSPRELRLRAGAAREHYAPCDLCVNDRRVGRTRGPAGRCGEGAAGLRNVLIDGRPCTPWIAHPAQDAMVRG